MSKQDRLELSQRLNALPYWVRLGYQNALDQGVATKGKVLKELREST